MIIMVIIDCGVLSYECTNETNGMLLGGGITFCRIVISDPDHCSLIQTDCRCSSVKCILSSQPYRIRRQGRLDSACGTWFADLMFRRIFTLCPVLPWTSDEGGNSCVLRKSSLRSGGDSQVKSRDKSMRFVLCYRGAGRSDEGLLTPLGETGGVFSAELMHPETKQGQGIEGRLVRT